jgi:hypothetical protein
METFVVRVYRPGRDAPSEDDRLRGVVEQISTGRQATFHDTSELLAILRRPQPGRPGESWGGHDAPGLRAPALADESQPLPDEGGGYEPGQREAR